MKLSDLPRRYQEQIYGTNKASRPPPAALPQPAVQHEPLAAAQREAGNAGRYVVRFTSFRRRLLDEDNLCPKYFCDSLRYAGLLPDDRPEVCHIETRQIKVAKKEDERTEIEIICP